jgi:transcriptional antiterminator RfaH
MRRWYVVNTQAHQETRAAENLSRQQFDVWLPRCRKTRKHGRRIDCVLAPLFPGYLFVSIDTDVQRWRSINGTFGVVRLLCHGDTPISVPDGLVEAMLARRDAGGAVSLAPKAFVKGQSVRVVGGPFADLEGLFQEMAGHDRVVLLLNLLGRKVRAIVPMEGLAA